MFFKEMNLDRKFVVTGGALLLSLLLFVLFPSTERLPSGVQSVIALFVFFLVFPLLYARFILGESWRGMGFRMEQSLSFWITVGVTVVMGFCLFFFAYSFFASLHEVYRLPFSVERSFSAFVQYELFLFLTVFFYEVFFRGFVMLLFLRRFGIWSAFLQWCVFILFLFASQSLGLDQLALLLFTPLSGFVAYRTQSLWYSFLASCFFFLSVDVFLLLAHR